MSKNNISIAVSADFFTAFAQIPKRQQTKVLEFVNKFRTDPRSSGINYERINAARDKNLRSVRIDNTYRGIVMKPEDGNVYLLLWVDHHDRAYEWAKDRRCDINPETGCIQVYVVDEVLAPAEALTVEQPCLFNGIRDREFLRLGVPEPQLELIKRIHAIDDLESLKDSLPVDCVEALTFLAQGDPLEEVLTLIDSYKGNATHVDIEDFATALHNPISLQKFSVDPSEQELEAMLRAPLEKWRVFLHPSQRYLVEKDWNGAVRLLGGAGTGKTVVALHRAKWLAENRCSDGDRILLTTFTKNLAADIENNLKTICSRKALERIQTVNLDKWVNDFLRQNDFRFEIDYGSRTAPLWEHALEALPPEATERFSHSFFREEWETIIQPEGITTLAEYFKASRSGRGTPMGRKERKLIWPIFEEYRIALNEHRLREPADAMREVRHLLQGMQRKPYRHIIIDEAQDMSKQAFLLIRAMAPEGTNDLFITGDAHQRIYGNRVVLGQCGINIRGRGKKLRINYRTTEEIRNWATAIMHGVHVDDLDGDLDSNDQYVSLMHGERPDILMFQDMHVEADALANYISSIIQHEVPLNDICLVARTNKLVEAYSQLLRDKGIKIFPIQRSQVDDRSVDGVRVATIHRVKGLEFNVMIIAGANDENLAPAGLPSDDQTIEHLKRDREQALLYVAATRAKKHLLITGYGRPYALFSDLRPLS